MDLLDVLRGVAAALASDATRVLTTLGVAVLGWVVGAAATRRKNTREDRTQVLAAIRAARRFQAPREYYDLDADLYLLRDALVPFTALGGHGRLVDKLTRALWRDSRQDWEMNEGEPGAGAYDTALADALDKAVAALSKRVRAPRWRQRYGARIEVKRLMKDTPLPDRPTLGDRPDSGSRVIDPTGFIAATSRLRRITGETEP